MIIRIVKMTFDLSKIEAFRSLFDEVKDKIIRFEGCNRLELLQDRDRPEIFFTYSLWDDIHALERYRSSELFRTTWKKTKQFFIASPEAWSVRKIQEAGKSLHQSACFF